MSNISRRDFLKTAGVMTLAVAAAGVLAGCEGNSATDNPQGNANQQTNDQINASKVFANKETATFGEYNHKVSADATLYKYYIGSDPSVYAAVVVMNATITAGAESTTTTDKAHYFGSFADGDSGDFGNNQTGAPNTKMTATIDYAIPKDFNKTEISGAKDQINIIHGTNTGDTKDYRQKVLDDVKARHKAGATLLSSANNPSTLTAFAKTNNIDKGGKSVYLMANVDDPNGEFPKTVSLSFYNSNYMAEGSEVNFKLDITKAVEVKL